ncbi:MAG: phosphoglucomutase/phosphomannomutase family protein [Acidobacteria bacterium]|nr:phosphoglucomutase/phosphomannomutase family protein [Acidobacteriota bacterium]
MTSPTCPIKFGTDGWRALIAEDYTFDNVRWAARGVAQYLIDTGDADKGVAIGYDCRFMSERFARAAAETIAAAGIPAHLGSSYAPTPAVACAIRQHQLAGGIVITASHNPWAWNGFKFKASYGGSAGPEIIKKVEAVLPQVAAADSLRRPPAALEEVDLVAPYVAHLEKVIHLDAIARRGFQFVVDPLYGAARGHFQQLFTRYKIRSTEIHGEADPLFGGLNPEPIEPHIAALQKAVVERRADAGFTTDGDADRIGAVDRDGRFIDSHRIFSILLQYLVEVRGLKGAVIKTFSTTKLVDQLAKKHALELIETPIGFKHICDHMLAREVIIGGEESGGIGVPSLGGPERDGMMNGLLLAEAMAHYGKSLGELVDELHREFGPHYYGRVDLHLKAGQKERAIEQASADGLTTFAGIGVEKREMLDGVKLYFDAGRGWLLVRPSGTEPLLRVYCEARSENLVHDALAATEKLIRAL